MTYCSQYTLPHGIKSRRELSQFGPRRQHWLNSPITATPKSIEVVRETRKSWGLAVGSCHLATSRGPCLGILTTPVPSSCVLLILCLEPATDESGNQGVNNSLFGVTYCTDPDGT